MTDVAAITALLAGVGRAVLWLVDKIVIGAAAYFLTWFVSDRAVRIVAWSTREDGAWFRLPNARNYLVSVLSGLVVSAVVALATGRDMLSWANLWVVAVCVLTALVKAQERIAAAKLILGILGEGPPTGVPAATQPPAAAGPPKRIVIFCDGTGNSPDDVQDGRRCISNVRKLFEMLVPHERARWQQVGWYDSGVGTGTSTAVKQVGTLGKVAGWIGAQVPARVLGLGQQFRTATELAFGVGITENIAQGYAEVVRQYRPGDKIYLFGFSRGAYTARCIAAVIARCGLLRAENAGLAKHVVTLYRYRPQPNTDVQVRAELMHPNPRVEFLGIWDTVPSLGVPLWGWWFTIGNLWRNSAFRNTAPDVCDVVRHALSIDEERSQFFPTLFDTTANGGTKVDVQQIWFRGSHAGVGGGYADCDVSDVSLEWMVAEASQHGLTFDPELCSAVKSNAFGRLYKQLELEPHWRLFGSWPRWHPCDWASGEAHPRAATSPYGALHPTVRERSALAAKTRSAPGIVTSEDLVFLAPRGGTIASPVRTLVYADRAWNRSGIVLEQDHRYRITYVEGGWEGANHERVGPGGSSTGRWRDRFSRVPAARWLELIGHVAHPRPWPLRELPGRKLLEYLLWRDPDELTRSLFRLGPHLPTTGSRVVVEMQAPSGVLYTLANAGWLEYESQYGGVVLEVAWLGPASDRLDGPDASAPRFVVNEDGTITAAPDPTGAAAGRLTLAHSRSN